MSQKVFTIVSSTAQYNDDELQFLDSLEHTEGIFGDPDTGIMGLQVAERGSPDMNVEVAIGDAYIEVVISGRTFKAVLKNTAIETVAIASNVSGSDRVDAIIARIDVDTEPDVLKTNIGTIERVNGSGATALTDGAITTLVGSDGWIRLADVTVVDSETAIENADITDTRVIVSTTDAVEISSGVPSGMVSPYAGDSAPTGYELCRGQALDRTSFSKLFAIIGEKFGVGDGSTTFNVPDLRTRTVFGLDDTESVVTIEDCETAWSESVAASVTVNADADAKVGTNSVEIIVGDAVTAGTILATEVITSTDLNLKGVLSSWFKSTVALDAGDLRLLLDDTASCASPLESIDIPAIPANTWVRVHLPLADQSLAKSLISIGIEMVVDKGAFTLNVDDIVASDFAELGALGGESAHKLSVAELASHTHVAGYASGASTKNEVGTGRDTTPNNTESTGDDEAHNNVPPFIILNNIIKT